MRSSIFILIILLNILTIATSQENKNYIDRHKSYKLEQEFFENSLYGATRYAYGKYIQAKNPAINDDFSNFKDDAAAMAAIAGLRADYMSGENELLSFINKKYPDPVTTPAIMELGNYYYNKKWYGKCIEIYEMIDPDDLTEYDMSEVSFKKGYAHFVSKEFDQAKKELSRTIKIQNIFYYPANYYYGLCEYFTKNYKAAVASFEKVKTNSVYKSFVPYYITQIYFAQGQYDDVIKHGEAALKDTDLRNRKEIRQLLGQSYFQKGSYELALPHLEYYEDNTEKLTVEEFYQLGFTQYQLKKYTNAISNFKELSQLNNKLGQMANYYLADCYYETGDMVSARAAFKYVSQMDFEKGMQEEALFNYGKLSAESGYEREAINTLIKIEKSSKYYTEAQNIILELLENTSDYASGIQIIEGLNPINDKLKVIYQNLALKYGIQQTNNGDTDNALVSFEKARKYQLSRITAAQSVYWTAHITHLKGNYPLSATYIDQYLTMADGITWMPDESTQSLAYYTQGYNYLQQKDYKKSEQNFKNAINLFNKDASKMKNTSVSDQVWPDALVRTGDCLFKEKKYNEALDFYNKAIQKKKGSQEYAMYQKGMIEGLTGEPYEKILTMRDIKTNYPNSEYADDALMQLGDTYFEVGHTDNAYNAYNDLVVSYDISPLYNDAQLKLGLIAYNKGDLNTAIGHYKAIFRHNPSSKQSESALLGLKEIYINDLGKSEEYVEYVSSLPGYNVSNAGADSLAYMVGTLRYNEGEYEKAIAGYSNYLTKYPKGAHRLSATYYRAESYTLLKKYDQALADYESLVNMGSSEFYVTSLKKAALISYNYTQSFEKAYSFYDQYYLKLSDEDEKYKAALGALRSAFRISQSDAIIKYAAIVSIHPKANADEQATAMYYAGKTHYKKNDLNAAKDNFDRAGKKANNNQAAESRYLVAEILYKQGDKSGAEAQCNAANDANASYPFWIAKSLLLLSDIYVDRNDLFNARAALEAVIENFSDDKDLLASANEKLVNVENLEKQNTRIKPAATSSNLLEMQSGGGN